ncbi:hypothetical protein K491DRAFT_784815 [Lophiostoma macrostomum CBS 122681]|uniref:Uncharacterized protein n=1 Tax=Lophiostoma macrostomum CBS 122681 TaxID=1314788 RepID=A0A6A6SIT8_9PLEO|nr:hypothetical protein K491DRAFT_784815 [Lophiostoma macrostomum CBS 122681]
MPAREAYQRRRHRLPAAGDQTGGHKLRGPRGHGIGITYAELDLDTGKEIITDEVKTAADLERHRKLYDMFEQDMADPDYDDTELKRELVRELIRDPRYADIRGPLRYLLTTVKSPEEQKAEDARIAAKLAEVERRMEPELQELEAQIGMVSHEMVQTLLDDPDLAPAHDIIRVWQSKMQDAQEGDPEMQALVEQVSAKLETIPAWHEKQAEVPPVPEGLTKEEQEEWIFEKFLAALTAGEQESPDASRQNAAELNVLKGKMKGAMSALGVDKNLENDILDLLDDDNDPRLADPLAHAELMDPDSDTPMESFDFEKLRKDIERLNKETPPEPPEEEKLDPQLEALVNRIMDDPSLMEKLALAKQALDETQADLTTRVQPCAPDPETLDKSRLTSYRQRLKMAENNPEHIAGLRRLRIDLLPPFSVSPALKSLNQALQLAYLGASDDVRRVLWRAYNKARTVPTLLRSIPDDAWDMLWYSQAVTWRSNQNRTNHLRILLHDLNSVGRDGPPTHPDTLQAD